MFAIISLFLCLIVIFVNVVFRNALEKVFFGYQVDKACSYKEEPLYTYPFSKT